MTTVGRIRTFDIVVDHLDGTIGRGAVNDQMRNLRIVLLKHTVKRTLKYLRSLVGDSDVGDLDHSP